MWIPGCKHGAIVTTTYISNSVQRPKRKKRQDVSDYTKVRTHKLRYRKKACLLSTDASHRLELPIPPPALFALLHIPSHLHITGISSKKTRRLLRLDLGRARSYPARHQRPECHRPTQISPMHQDQTTFNQLYVTGVTKLTVLGPSILLLRPFYAQAPTSVFGWGASLVPVRRPFAVWMP
jgi:hypothetical protein